MPQNEFPQRLENADHRQPLAGRLERVLHQHAIKRRRPGAEPGQRLNRALILEGRRLRPHDLADRVARQPQIAGNLLDRLALDEELPSDPADRLHRQHPPVRPSRGRYGQLETTTWKGG